MNGGAAKATPMTKELRVNDVKKRLGLQDGSSMVLLDTLGKKALGRVERARNIYLLDSGGHTIWQVSSDFDHDGGPFTNIVYENGELRAYRWDGGMYKIDLKSGKASPSALTK